MISTRKQKANGKGSRQSDVMSDIQNLDYILGNFTEKHFERQELEGEVEMT